MTDGHLPRPFGIASSTAMLRRAEQRLTSSSERLARSRKALHDSDGRLVEFELRRSAADFPGPDRRKR